MNIYFALFIAIGTIALFKPVFASIRSRNLVWGLVVCVLAIFIGLRDEIGCDWGRYAFLFDYFNSRQWGEFFRPDVGYVAINKLAGALGGSIHLVNFAFACLLMGSIWVFLRREPEPFLGLIVLLPTLVFIAGMSATRQVAAVSCLFLAIHFIPRVRYRALGVAAAGVLFHPSSLVTLPLIAIASGGRSNRWFYRVIVLGSAAVMLAALATSATLERYLVLYGEGELQSGGAIFRTGITALFGATALVFSRRWQAVFGDFQLWRWFAVAALALFTLSFLNSVVADRLSLYLMPLNAVVAARLPVLLRRYRSSMMLQGARLAMIGMHFAVVWTLLVVAELSWCSVPYYWVL